MNFSLFKVLKHVPEASDASYTIYQHKENVNELFMLREELSKTKDKFQTTAEHLNVRKKLNSAHLLKIYKVDANPSNRQFYVMTEYSLHNLTNVHLRSFESVIKCILDVLKGLSDLSRQNMHHGDVTFESILYFPKFKTFKLRDRIIPFVALYSFYKKRINSNQDFFVAPRLFNDISNKSVKSLKINYQKNDVFSIGMIALKLLYPFIVKVDKFYSHKNKLFDTVQFTKLLSTLIKTAKNEKEAELLALLKYKFVCFDEAQRASPEIALSELHKFLKHHYHDFESTFLSQNILLDNIAKDHDALVSSSLNHLNEHFGNQESFQRDKTFITETLGDSNLKYKSNENQTPKTYQNNDRNSQRSQINLNILDRESQFKTGIPNIGGEFGKNSHFEKIIDFEEMQSQPDKSQNAILNANLEESIICDQSEDRDFCRAEHFRSTLQGENEICDNHMYQIFVKIDVKKIKNIPSSKKETIIDLGSFSKFAINVENESLKIKSRSVNVNLPRNDSQLDEHSYNSIENSPLNLNFIATKNKSKNGHEKDDQLNYGSQNDECKNSEKTAGFTNFFLSRSKKEKLKMSPKFERFPKFFHRSFNETTDNKSFVNQRSNQPSNYNTRLANYVNNQQNYSGKNRNHQNKEQKLTKLNVLEIAQLKNELCKVITSPISNGGTRRSQTHFDIPSSRIIKRLTIESDLNNKNQH
jgi:hypothetical protein